MECNAHQPLTPPKVKGHPHTRLACQLCQGVESCLTTRKKTDRTERSEKHSTTNKCDHAKKRLTTEQYNQQRRPFKRKQERPLNSTTNKGDHSGERDKTKNKQKEGLKNDLNNPTTKTTKGTIRPPLANK